MIHPWVGGAAMRFSGTFVLLEIVWPITPGTLCMHTRRRLQYMPCFLSLHRKFIGMQSSCNPDFKGYLGGSRSDFHGGKGQTPLGWSLTTPQVPQCGGGGGGAALIDQPLS